MSRYPLLAIEWLPDGAPNDSTGSWVALTPYVSTGSMKRGRQYELDRTTAGQLTLNLKVKKSAGRLFDPENTAGTYYGKLLPMKQIRVTWDGDPVFRGYVTSWGTTEPDDAYFATTITAKDGFERLERYRLPSSAWALEVGNDDPTCWFRLGESDTPRVTDSSDGGNYGLYDNCQQGQQGLVVNDNNGAAAFAHSLEERVKVQNPELITGYPFTVSMAFKVSGDDPAGTKMLFWGALHPPVDILTAGGGGLEIMMINNSGGGVPGRVFVALSDASGNYRSSYFNLAQLDDGLPHLIHAVFNSASSLSCYLDGLPVTISNGTAGTGTPAWPGPIPGGYTIGNVSDIGLPDFGFGVNDTAAATVDNPFPVKERGTIDEFTCYDGTAVASNRVEAQWAAFQGWDGDLTGLRVERFLDTIGMFSGMRYLNDGISTLGPAAWSENTSALAVMQSWADTELGMFFMGKDGWVNWLSRHNPIYDPVSNTSQATFGDRWSGATLRYANNGLELVRDENLIRNPVTASRTKGVTVQVSDQDLIDDFFGDRSWSMPGSEDQLDSAVRDRANWGLARFKNLKTRLRSVTIEPDRAPATHFPAVMDRELGHRITIQRKPGNLGSLISLDFIIESIEHKFDVNGKWVTKFSGSPVDDMIDNYALLDDSTFGIIGADDTFTVVAATDVFTFADSGGIANGTPVVLKTAPFGAAPLAVGTTYWVVNSSGATFKLSATQGGSAINITSDGFGALVSTNGQLLAY